MTDTAPRGRKPLAAAVQHGPQFVGAAPPEMAAAEARMREAGGMPTHEQARDWITAALAAGRLQAAMVSATVAQRMIAEVYSSLAKSKTYEGLPYTKPNGESATVASLDDFCEVFLGRSKRRCQELAANLDTLGTELYDAAERIGLGQRDYNALKALPADEQKVIKQALAEGADKPAVVGLLAGLVERKAQALENARGDIAAKETRIAALSEQINRAEERAHKLARLNPDETAARMLQELYADLEVAKNTCRQATTGIEAFFQYCAEHELREHLGDLENSVMQLLRAVTPPLPSLQVAGVEEPFRYLRAIVG
ncbi:MAG: hypothetical protein JSR26_04055 [Proteobacteria bacterium]|nr:hypothetical protein [Pseudomonadota bacterium]